MDNQQVQKLTDQFEALDINPETFLHTEHVAVAWEMLQRYDFLEAAYRYGTSLNTIATKAGAADKFHITVTIAMLSLISERMAEGKADSFESFRDTYPEIFEKQTLAGWYSTERIGSDAARRRFVMPDRVHLQ